MANRILIAAFVAASFLGSSACVSYKKQVSETSPPIYHRGSATSALNHDRIP
jgi:hypothetical protein